MSHLSNFQKPFRAVIAAILLLFCLTDFALAQRSTASVAGSVTDESGATVPGAEVVARNLATRRGTLCPVERSRLLRDLGPGSWAVFPER
jgi:hypothetical protein